jgi:hypothetical protein
VVQGSSLDQSADRRFGAHGAAGRSERSEDAKRAKARFCAKLAGDRLHGPARFSIAFLYGWVAEWFKAPVLKTGVAETLP